MIHDGRVSKFFVFKFLHLQHFRVVSTTFTHFDAAVFLWFQVIKYRFSGDHEKALQACQGCMRNLPAQHGAASGKAREKGEHPVSLISTL